jgi:hypothetical protein
VPADRLLDQIQSLAASEALAAEPGRYAGALAAELPESREARVAAITAALAQIDALAARVMKLRLDHALASDTAIAPPTRRVFATTIVGYASDLGVLTARVRDVAMRTRGADPDRVAALVTDAARATLALRDALRAPVLALVPPAPAPAPVDEPPAREPTLAELLELD